MSYEDVQVNNKNFTDYKYACTDKYEVGKDNTADITANAQTIFFENQVYYRLLCFCWFP